MRNRNTVMWVAIVFFLAGALIGFILGGNIPIQFLFGQPTPTPTRISRVIFLNESPADLALVTLD